MILNSTKTKEIVFSLPPQQCLPIQVLFTMQIEQVNVAKDARKTTF